MEKNCKSCGLTKSIVEFYKHSQMKDGRLNDCKECYKTKVKINREERIEYYQAFEKNRSQLPHRVLAREIYSKTSEGKAARLRASDKWDWNNLIKKNAICKVNNAIKAGSVFKHPCFVCGSIKFHGHHPDYSQPLDVVWLCPKHHKETHLSVSNQMNLEGVQ